MIIDAHAHTSAPATLGSYKAALLSHRGAHGRGEVRYTEQMLLDAWNRKEMAPVGHLDHAKNLQIDFQLISPRPFQAMHSEKPGYLVQWYTHEVNKIIRHSVELMPDKMVGIGSLAQEAGEPVEVVFAEMERCVKEYGFKGFLINPDPYENSGVKAPPMGDRYWYPLYEKAVELNVPLHIHTSGSRNPIREPYSMYFVNEETTAVWGLVQSKVFDDFPDLKIVCSHGGGSIPYQLGRFQSTSMKWPAERGTFIDRMRKMYFDSVLYSKEALELLIKVVGPDNVIFGSECPGVGSNIDPDRGTTFDDIVPYIKDFDFISASDKEKIFSGNAIKVFNLAL